MATLRLYLFGGLRAYEGEDPLPPFPTQKTRSLLAYLATFHQQSHRRALLAETLWEGTPAAQAGRNLNTTLWRLRKTIPPGSIEVQGDRVGLAAGSDCWIDTACFEKLLRQAGPERRAAPAAAVVLQDRQLAALLQAAELYRGDLLEGLDEGWSLVEAERLRTGYLETLLRLLGHYRALGQPEQALGYAQRLLAVDPLREDIHREAMELYVALGRPDQALAQFRQCRQLLYDELGAAPLAETVALFERLQAGRPEPPGAAAIPEPRRPEPLPRTPFDDLGQVPLVGRDEERTVLAARLAAAARGQGGMVLVDGEAGVGKTRLVRGVCRQSESRGWLVLCGRCLDLGEPPPYQAWVEALRPALFDLRRHALACVPRAHLAELTLLLPELAHLFPGLPPPATIPPRQRQEQLQQALCQLLAGLSQEQPLLLLLEDLQWADAASLEALSMAVPRLRDRPVLVIGTARTEESSPRLQECSQRLDRGGNWQRMALSRLSHKQTALLTGTVLGWAYPAPRFIQRLYQETQGNPLFVLEVLKGLYEEGILARSRGGQWLVGGESVPEGAPWPLPATIRQVVLRRLARLDLRGRHLLQVAAVLGTAVDPEMLRQLCGWDEESFLEISNDLLRRQILLEAGGQYHFAHEQIRQVIYRGIDRTRRRDLHRQAGHTLEQRAPERAEELAFHYDRGQLPGRALACCMQAGDRAYAVQATSAALAYFGQAISAAKRLGRAAARPSLLRAHELRGQILESQGDYVQASAEYTALLALAREAGDTAAVARAIRCSGWLHGYRQEQWDLGLREARRAYEVAVAADDATEKAAALRDIGAYESMRGAHDAALEALQAALGYARECGDVAEEANILQYIAIGLLFLSQDDRALEVFQQALAIRERLGDRRMAAKIRSNIGLLQINRGEFASAEQSLRQAESGFREAGALPALPLTWIGLATVLRYRGDPAGSLPLLDMAAEVQGAVGSSSAYLDGLICLHRGAARWDLGQLHAALEDTRRSVELARQSGTPTLVVGCLRHLGCCLRQAGAHEEALACHREAVDLAGQVSFARGRGENLVESGLAELARGQLPAARRDLLEAMRLAGPHGPQMRAEACAAWAELCLAEWRLCPARALAARTLALAEQMGLRNLQASAHLLLGKVLALQLRLPEAEAALRRALELSEPPGSPLGRWEVLLSLAHLLDGAGRHVEAQQVSAEARRAAVEAMAALGEGLRAAFARQPAVLALLGESEPCAPGQARSVLARLGAPTGRPLRPAEQVAVLWERPPAAGAADRVEARRSHLLLLVHQARAQGGDPGEVELAQVLGVSARTVRSDIAALRAAGRPVRTRGTKAP